MLNFPSSANTSSKMKPASCSCIPIISASSSSRVSSCVTGTRESNIFLPRRRVSARRLASDAARRVSDTPHRVHPESAAAGREEGAAAARREPDPAIAGLDLAALIELVRLREGAGSGHCTPRSSPAATCRGRPPPSNTARGVLSAHVPPTIVGHHTRRPPHPPFRALAVSGWISRRGRGACSAARPATSPRLRREEGGRRRA